MAVPRGRQWLFVSLCGPSMGIDTHIYIYIYIEREREIDVQPRVRRDEIRPYEYCIRPPDCIYIYIYIIYSYIASYINPPYIDPILVPILFTMLTPILLFKSIYI